MAEDEKIIQEFTSGEYKEGFVTDVEQEFVPKGLNEDIIRTISRLKEEPAWLLEFRLDAFRKWQQMEMPRWAHLDLPEIDFQDIIYYAAPKKDKDRPKEIDPKLAETFEKLGIPLKERDVLAGVVAVDAVFDSVSVTTTFRKTLAEKGIIFCSFSEAVKEHPDLVRKYLATVVPAGDNYFAALNSAVFSDGSFCYIPKGVRCPMDLSSYFRINARGTGIDPEIAGKVHRTTHPLGNVAERSVGENGAVQGREIVVPGRDHGREIFPDEVGVLLDRLGERAEDDALLRERLPEGGSD